MNMGLNRNNILIIWANNRPIENMIEDILSKNYIVRKKYEITWSESFLEQNYSRLLGRKVLTKEIDRTFGIGAFLLYIFDGDNDKRTIKQVFRKNKIKGLFILTGNEANRVVTLILGKNINDSLNDNIDTLDTIALRQDLVGANGWESLEQFFYVLNNTINYCVLRNAEDITKDFNPTIHGDIDFLIEKQQRAIKVMGVTKVYNENYRTIFETIVAGKPMRVDLKYVGDHYYCREWERKMINASQEIVQDGISVRVMPPIDQFYALLYHAYLQKDEVASDYPRKLTAWARKAGETYKNDARFLMKQLDEYMMANHYKYEFPNDITMPINWSNLRLFSNYCKIRYVEWYRPNIVLFRADKFVHKAVRKFKRILGV